MTRAIIVNRLLRWARWRLGSGVHLGFNKQVSFLRLTPPSTVGHDVLLERDCMETDAAFNALPLLHQSVIRLEFLTDVRKDEDKARCVGISIRSFRQYRNDAYDKIDNIIYDMYAKEDMVN